LPQDLSVIDGCTFDPKNTADPCLERWKADGGGPYGVNGTAIAAVLRSSVAESDPDLFVFGLVGDFRGYAPRWPARLFGDHRHITFGVLKAHTRNHAGTVTLTSTDPCAVPAIRFHSFEEGTTANDADARDLDALVEGVEFARSISEEMSKALGSVEVSPGASVVAEDLRAETRARAWGHHASCTCAMGADSDPMAVLDSRFRVRGTKNLRVVDASAFPKIPGFFIVAAIYMLSEKASDVLLQDARCSLVATVDCPNYDPDGIDVAGGG
jgi:choline dehydrogenase-like flavoprotein